MKEEDIDKRIERVIGSVASKKSDMSRWGKEYKEAQIRHRVARKRWWIYGIPAAASIILICVIGISLFLDIYREPSGNRTFSTSAYRGEAVDLSEISAMIDSAKYDEALGAIAISMADTTIDLSYTPERQQYLRDLNKSRIYELKWMKIDVLIKSGRKNEAIKLLESFVKEEGVHKSEAKKLLKSLHE